MSSVEQIGQTDVVVDEALEEDDANAEWQAGVFSADNPADKAM